MNDRSPVVTLGLVASLLGAAGCGSGGPATGSGGASSTTGGGGATTTSGTSGSGGATTASGTTGSGGGAGSGGTGTGTALPLGTATLQMMTQCGPASAVPESECYQATISGCDGIADATARLKITEPLGAAIGTIILGTGGGGGGFYESFAPAAQEIILPLLKLGYRVVQRSWQGQDGWLTGPGGSLKLACRYATLIEAIFTQLHTGGGFCVSGNSGGSAEISYALAGYGMDGIIDLAVPTSGPPMGRIDYGCLGDAAPGWSALCATLLVCQGGACGYGTSGAATLDGTYGPGVSTCQMKDPALAPTWLGDSVLFPGASLDYPKTEVHFLFGKMDCSEAVPLGRVYANAITSLKTTTTVVDGAPHALPGSVPGAQQVFSVLKDGCKPNH